MKATRIARNQYHVVQRIPQAGPSPSDGWVDDTNRLIEGFEQDFAAYTGDDADAGASFIIAASDCLWALHGLEATWGRLSIDDLLMMFADFAIDPDWVAGCLSTLAGFYTYLTRRGEVSRDAATRIQRDLLARLREQDPELFEHGLRMARGLNRAERRWHAHAARRGLMN